MGYEKDTTPNLNQLAEDGVVFENAIAPGPATPQSMPAIFTGSYPHEHVDSDGFDTRSGIKAHIDRSWTIPEQFSEIGYDTAGFSPNPFASRYYGFNAGFDEYQDFLNDDSLSSDFRSRIVTRWIQNETIAGARFLINMLGLGNISMTWESYYETVRKWVENAEEPYFLWLFLLEPHWPYRPPRRHREHSLWSMYRANWQRAPASDTIPADKDVLLDLYDSGIKHADELFARLGADLSGDPAIVVHADHGEEFGEHGNYGHCQLYEETIQVPFIIGNISYSQLISTSVSLTALPDILRSLAVKGDGWLNTTSPLVISRRGTDDIAVRSESWKYIDQCSDELYHLEVDPTESENISERFPDVTELLLRVGACH